MKFIDNRTRNRCSRARGTWINYPVIVIVVIDLVVLPLTFEPAQRPHRLAPEKRALIVERPAITDGNDSMKCRFANPVDCHVWITSLSTESAADVAQQ